MHKIILSLVCIAVSCSPSLATDENKEDIEPRDHRAVIKHILRVSACAQVIAPKIKKMNERDGKKNLSGVDIYHQAEVLCGNVSPNWNSLKDGFPVLPTDYD